MPDLAPRAARAADILHQLFEHLDVVEGCEPIHGNVVVRLVITPLLLHQLSTFDLDGDPDLEYDDVGEEDTADYEDDNTAEPSLGWSEPAGGCRGRTGDIYFVAGDTSVLVGSIGDDEEEDDFGEEDEATEEDDPKEPALGWSNPDVRGYGNGPAVDVVGSQEDLWSRTKGEEEDDDPCGDDGENDEEDHRRQPERAADGTSWRPPRVYDMGNARERHSQSLTDAPPAGPSRSAVVPFRPRRRARA